MQESLIETQQLEQRVIDALRGIYDPEIPVNIYDLGLIYYLEVEPDGEVLVHMTLTAPGCPVAQTFPGTVESRIRSVPGVNTAKVELVWEPPWSKDNMSEAAKLQLGMMDEPSSVPQHLVEGKPIRVVPAVTTPSSSAPTATQSWVEVASVEQLPPGSWRVVDVEGAAVAVFNLYGQYFAIEDVCTHDGGTLTGGTVEGDQIVCPRHGARFSIKTGAVLCPPAYEPIARLPVRVHAGVIQVRDNRWD